MVSIQAEAGESAIEAQCDDLAHYVDVTASPHAVATKQVMAEPTESARARIAASVHLAPQAA